LTYALATQLFVTLDGPLSDAATAELGALWGQIVDVGARITEVPLSEIQSRLTGFEQQILQIIEKDQGRLTPQQATTTSPVDPADPSDTPTDKLLPSDSTIGGTSATPGNPSSTTSPTGSSVPSPGEPGQAARPSRTSGEAAVQDGGTGDTATATGGQATEPAAGTEAAATTGAFAP
jgi:putative peptide zinc metalloprotease protein